MFRVFGLLFFTLALQAAETKTEDRLGPKILIESDPTSLISNISVIVLTGSIDDPVTKVGLTNMVGEMVLRGTKKKNRSKFQSEMERMGASLSVHTTQELMLFDGKVIKENTGAFLKLLEDALLHPAMGETEFKELKTEVLAEVSHIKNANNRLGGLSMRREFFKGTALERPIIGSLSTVNNIQLSDIVRAYNNHFDRANILFAVASPLPDAELTNSFTQIWSQFPNGMRVARKYPTPQVPSKPTLVVIHKPQTSTGSLIFAQAGITAQDPSRFALIAGNFSFGGEPLVSRLFRTIRGELGYTYAIGSTYNALGGLANQQGVYFISSTPSVEFTTKTIFKTIEMWKQYLKEGLTSDELKLAHESLVNSYPFEFETAEKRLGMKLHSYLYNVPILNQEEYAETIEGVSNSKLKETLATRHQSENWYMALVADKDIIEKQLAEFQKDIPADQQLKISKVLTPNQIIE